MYTMQGSTCLIEKGPGMLRPQVPPHKLFHQQRRKVKRKLSLAASAALRAPTRGKEVERRTCGTAPPHLIKSF
jgi:hypothetical protein